MHCTWLINTNTEFMENFLAIFEHFADQGNIFSYIIVFVFLLISGLGLPLPEDITLVSAGILASQGYADVHVMFIVCMAGVLIGDSTMYLIGYANGVRILRFRWIKKMLSAKRIRVMRTRFQQNSIAFLFVARFLPGLRAGIYLFSGLTHKVPYRKFIAIDFVASAISVPVWVYLGDLFGSNLDYLKHLVHKIGLGVSLAAVVFVVGLIFFIKSSVGKKLNKATQIDTCIQAPTEQVLAEEIQKERAINIERQEQIKERKQEKRRIKRQKRLNKLQQVSSVSARVKEHASSLKRKEQNSSQQSPASDSSTPSENSNS